MGCTASVPAGETAGPNAARGGAHKSGPAGGPRLAPAAQASAAGASEPPLRSAAKPGREVVAMGQEPEAVLPAVVARGRCVKSMDTHGGKNVLFLFGGPGAGKGQVVETLCAEFGFSAIAVEAIALEQARRQLLQHSPGHAAKTSDVLAYLVNHPDAVTLESVLQQALDMLRMDPRKTNFVIDLVPNHHALCTRTGLLKEGAKDLASADYAEFHARCAIVLAVAKAESSRPQRRELQGDEADARRRRDRSMVNSMSSQALVSFFERTERTSKITCSVPNQRITKELRVLMRELGFPRTGRNVHVLLRRSDEEHLAFTKRFSDAGQLSLPEQASPQEMLEAVDRVAGSNASGSSVVVLTAPWACAQAEKQLLASFTAEGGLVCQIESVVVVDGSKVDLSSFGLRAYTYPNGTTLLVAQTLSLG